MIQMKSGLMLSYTIKGNYTAFLCLCIHSHLFMNHVFIPRSFTVFHIRPQVREYPDWIVTKLEGDSRGLKMPMTPFWGEEEVLRLCKGWS